MYVCMYVYCTVLYHKTTAPFVCTLSTEVVRFFCGCTLVASRREYLLYPGTCHLRKTVPQPELDFGFKMAKSCGQKLWRAYPVYTSRNTSCGELSNIKLWPKAVAKSCGGHIESIHHVIQAVASCQISSCGQKLWRTYPVYTSRNTRRGGLSSYSLDSKRSKWVF